jgi:CelD/BcsL family acetyltransferase involved in cellulose biosynthesis
MVSQSQLAMERENGTVMGEWPQLRLYESLEALAGLRPEWEELVSGVPTATVFSTWEWLAPWWRAFGMNQRLLVLGYFDSPSQLVGLAPLSLTSYRARWGAKRGLLRLMGDGSGDSDNLDLPVLPGREEEFAQALLDYLQQRADLWDFARFRTMPSHSLVGNMLLKLLDRRAWTHFRHSRPWSVVPLPESWEAYLRGIPSREREKIPYRSRKIDRKYKARFFRCSRESELPNCLEALFRLHQSRWETRHQPGSFSAEERKQFYYEIGRLFLARGWLELWLLELNGSPVAAQFGFRYRDTVFGLQSGFDPQYSTDSVAYVLFAYVLKQLIASGVRRYDFLAGDSPEKSRWGTQVGAYMDIEFARPLSPGSYYLLLRHLGGETKEWLRTHLSRSAWRVLQWAKSQVRRG